MTRKKPWAPISPQQTHHFSNNSGTNSYCEKSTSWLKGSCILVNMKLGSPKQVVRIRTSFLQNPYPWHCTIWSRRELLAPSFFEGRERASSYIQCPQLFRGTSSKGWLLSCHSQIFDSLTQSSHLEENGDRCLGW